MAVNTDMSGREIDKNLRAILAAMNTNNNGKVIYIKRGELAFEDGDLLFNVATPE